MPNLRGQENDGEAPSRKNDNNSRREPLCVLYIGQEGLRRTQEYQVASGNVELRVVGFGQSVLEAIVSAGGNRPDVVIVDVDSLELSNPSPWLLLRTSFSLSTPIVALTEGNNMEAMRLALIAGLAGLQSKRIPASEFVSILRRVVDGGVEFDQAMLDIAKEMLIDTDKRDLIRVGGITIDLNSHSVWRWGNELRLTSLEYGVLELLAENRGKSVPVDDLLREVWGTTIDGGGTMDQVKSCIKRLRQKLEPIPGNPRYIIWDGRSGYILRDPYPIFKS